MAPALADDLRQLFLCIAEPLDEITVAARLFYSIQIGTLNVLDNRKLERFLAPQMLEQMTGSPEEFAALIKAESRKWEKVIRERKITAN